MKIVKIRADSKRHSRAQHECARAIPSARRAAANHRRSLFVDRNCRRRRLIDDARLRALRFSHTTRVSVRCDAYPGVDSLRAEVYANNAYRATNYSGGHNLDTRTHTRRHIRRARIILSLDTPARILARYLRSPPPPVPPISK